MANMGAIERIGKIIGTAQFVAEKAGENATALALRLSPLACGNTVTGVRVHDHKTSLFPRRQATSESGLYASERGSTSNVPYDEEKHGAMDKNDWVEEGEPIPGEPKSTTGKTPIHRHNAGNSIGVHEFNYE